MGKKNQFWSGVASLEQNHMLKCPTPILILILTTSPPFPGGNHKPALPSIELDPDVTAPGPPKLQSIRKPFVQ